MQDQRGERSTQDGQAHVELLYPFGGVLSIGTLSCKEV
jgi:hypothetical protein